MTADRLDEQREFRARQRDEVERARQMPVEQARERLRELADRERAFLVDQQRGAHATGETGRGGGRTQ
jgi:hypothetical protein